MKSCIIKRSFTFKALLPSLMSVLISLVIGFISVIFIPSLFIPILAIGVIIAIAIAPGNIFTEYEYNLEGESFSVALIRNNSSRKELFSCDMEHLISCEPYTNQRINGAKFDYSEKVNTPYCALFNENGKQASVIFSPDEAFVRELFLIAPGKVKHIM